MIFYNKIMLVMEKQYQRLWFLISFCVVSFLCYAGDSDYRTLKNGLEMTVPDGRLRVEFVETDIVRVQYTCEATFKGNGTIVCLPREEKKTPFTLKEMEKKILLISDSLIISIDRSNYAITYMDACNNRVLLAERYERPREAEKVFKERVIYDEQSKRMVKTADGEKEVKDVLHRDTVGYTWKYRNHFDWTDKEAIYGLGCHMEDYLNLQGKELWFCQHNLKAMVPVLNSTAGYGLLFDAGCGMYYNNTAGNGFMEMEAAKQLDYYFMKGVTMDKVINRYRLLTGKSPMLPLYILGYIQSKERYRTSVELIDVVAEYRRRQVPLDVVVQDWNYWPNGSWGYMKMDRKRYPNLRNLTDSIHQLNAKLMASIWPNPTNSPQTEEFKSKGFMLQRSVYDAFNSGARKLYWKYADDEFFSNGFDAWWCDCTEPVDADWSVMPEGYGWDNQQERWKRNLKALNDLLGEERSCLFSLYHSKGIYENQRATSEKKRVVNLTRSSYAGQQRFATITWNGDTHASWKSFAAQIPGGLNFMAAGCPYWTLDAGTFFSATKKQWFWRGQYNQGVTDMGYREFYVRMLQFATFLPLLRSHGTDTPREIWQFGNPGEAFTKVF